jgi:hypothetical protein
VKLADVQALFYDLVTAPEDVKTTLRGRAPVVAADVAAKVATEIAGDARLPPEARLDIYGEMYFFRIHDVLRDEAPRTAAALGEAAFHNLVTDYLRACPPNHPSLREAGARLPAFLATHPFGVERPWLAELARLERTRHELFDGPDAEALTLAHVRALPPEQIGALTLRAIPCHRLLENGFPISSAWRAEPPAAAAPTPAPETLLVWRPDLEVRHRVVASDEVTWLRRLSSAPSSFGALCDALAHDDSVEAAAAQAFALVARWLADGLLSRHG